MKKEFYAHKIKTKDDSVRFDVYCYDDDSIDGVCVIFSTDNKKLAEQLKNELNNLLLKYTKSKERDCKD